MAFRLNYGLATLVCLTILVPQATAQYAFIDDRGEYFCACPPGFYGQEGSTDLGAACYACPAGTYNGLGLGSAFTSAQFCDSYAAAPGYEQV
jgi:hypothetical protein